MTRRILAILLFLLLGAVTTIAVAWACALLVVYERPARAFQRPTADSVPRDPRPILVHHAFGSKFALVSALEPWEVESRGVAVEPLDRIAYHWSDLITRNTWDGFFIEAEEARGWPMLSLRWAGTQVPGARFDIEHGIDLGGPARGFHVRASGGAREFGGGWIATYDPGIYRRTVSGLSERILPYGPIWKGLIGDSVFYAFAWALLAFTARGVRRSGRRRRGRCPMCGYDLRGDLTAGCPECGWNRGDR